MTMRQVPRASSIAARQRPGGSGGSPARYAPPSPGESRNLAPLSAAIRWANELGIS